MRGVLALLLLCYLSLTPLAALVLAPNNSTSWLLSDEIKTSNSPNTSNSNLSNSSNSTALGDFYPLTRRFRVPGTNTVLRLGFGMRHAVDPIHVRSLIAVAEDYIDEAIENLPPPPPGLEELYPIVGGRYQIFYKTLGDGIALVIRNNDQAGKMFSWQELRDVVVGLRLYLVDGGRFWQTWFKFYQGDFAPDVTTRFLGYGGVITETYESDDEMDTELAAEKRG